jgi:hypothetical protein
MEHLDERTEKAIVAYVNEHSFRGDELIEEFCEKQPPITKTIYRGQPTTTINEKRGWRSGSRSIDIARDEFSNKKNSCCVFKIHLVNVPAFYIPDFENYLREKYTFNGKDTRDESLKIQPNKLTELEYIFLGKGTYYKNAAMTEPGFKPLIEKTGRSGSPSRVNTYECWYSVSHPATASRAKTPSPQKTRKMASPPKLSPSKIAGGIPEDELDLIDTQEDLVSGMYVPVGTTPKTLVKIWEKVKERKSGANPTAGGRRKTRRNKK